MAQLQWHDASEQSAPRPRPSPPVSVHNPWFAVAMGLAGVIVGYGIGTF